VSLPAPAPPVGPGVTPWQTFVHKIMEFKLHKNFSELNPTEWNNLLSESISDVPFLRYEYLSAWWETRGGGEWEQAELALISANENDKLIGIAPLFLSEHVGKQALLLLGSIEISDYLDLIVRADDLPRFLSGLLDFIASDSPLAWSAFDWYNLPDNSPTLAALESESAKRGWEFTQESFRPSLSVPLPGDFDVYLASINKKQRHEIRRKMRRAEADEREVRWYIVEDESTLDAEADACCHLMAQDPAKQAFLTQTMRTQMKATIHAFFKAGILQLSFLEVDGQKAAGYLNFDYGNRIYVYNSGLDFNYGDLSPGWVLLGYLLQWANENGRAAFDFMRGDEDYKYKFGGVKRDVMRVRVERK
jgi:CelD/BcsL family acetyltransferase involved in cellulose biosynthesis